MDKEAVRAQYRPQRIATLFVGESPPASGKFFYYGNTALARNMEAAMLSAGLGGNGNFLERFKEQGWYLDDLILQPVNRQQRAERRRKWRESQDSLADRIKVYKPRAIVSLLLAMSRLPQRRLAATPNCSPCHFPAMVSKRASERRWCRSCRSFLAIRKTARTPQRLVLATAHQMHFASHAKSARIGIV